MRIRFLQTVESEAVGFPFRAGQVISVPAPSPFLLDLCDGVRAELLREPDIEVATVAPAEQAVTRGSRKKKPTWH